jgi:Icc-related predicted phosphoesterase
MKILAVSDIPSQSLETMIETTPERFKDINLIISCGDLDTEYLEFIVDGINRDLMFVCGNHQCNTNHDYFSTLRERIYNYHRKIVQHVAGRADLHGRVEAFNEYLVAGFGGSMRYSSSENQYTEKEMARIVRQVIRKIKWHRLQDALLGRPQREVIVVSHAPLQKVHDQPDLCHTGFQCFHDFIRETSPLLWLHGHVHLTDLHQNQISIVEQSTVVNVFGCKIVDIDQRSIQVLSHCAIDNKKTSTI